MNMLEKMTPAVEKMKDKWEFTFPAEQSELPYAFYLQPTTGSPEKSIYATVHFDGKSFRSPDNKSEILLSDFVTQLREKLGAKKITLSCCYPDSAKQVAGDMHGVEIIGSGNCEVRTKFNDRQGVLTVEQVQP